MGLVISITSPKLWFVRCQHTEWDITIRPYHPLGAKTNCLIQLVLSGFLFSFFGGVGVGFFFLLVRGFFGGGW